MLLAGLAIVLLAVPCAVARFSHTEPFAKFESETLYTCLDISPDGLQVAAGDMQGKIDLWDFQTGTKTRTIYAHAAQVRTIDYSPDGRFLATGSYDEYVRVWDVATGDCIAELRHPEWVWNVQFSPDGTRMVSAGGLSYGQVFVWSVGDFQKVLELYDFKDRVEGLGVGRSFFTVESGGPTIEWDLVTGEKLAENPDSTLGGTTVEISRSGKYLASTNTVWVGERLRRVLDLTDRSTGTVVAQLPAGGAVFSKDESLLATVGGRRVPSLDAGLYGACATRVFETSTGRELAKVNSRGHLTGVCFSPDGQFVLTAGRNVGYGVINVYRVEDLIEN